ncbi:MAG: HD domain-containing protein [Lachnospiraceae bacterium]|nr:HD domain-containing protein [Lachnospiraceae bacterium]
MKYIEAFRDGDNISDIYLVKHRQSAETKNGKPYENLILQDKTGTIDAKIWEPNSAGIEDFEVLDYVMIGGSVTSFNGALQVSVKRARKCREGEYDPADYLPVSSKNIDEMFQKLRSYISGIQNTYLKQLLEAFFISDREFAAQFCKSSAAKSIHHGFVGGLLEHTLSVANLCNYLAGAYPTIHKDLLISAAILHDIGKTRELSLFPENDYTDDGQLLGHIVMGVEMVSEKIAGIPGFPAKLAGELKHCILAHHGEYEFGSPKKPALIEAVALHFADNTDAKLETMTELLASAPGNDWLGYNRMLESNVRRTSE